MSNAWMRTNLAQSPRLTRTPSPCFLPSDPNERAAQDSAAPMCCALLGPRGALVYYMSDYVR